MIIINALSPPSGLTALPTNGVTDVSALISAMISFIKNNYGAGTIYIPNCPNGYKIIAGQISLEDNISIIGNNTKLIIDNKNPKEIFIIYTKNNVSIDGFYFYSPSFISAIDCIHIQDGSKNIRILNCKAENQTYLVKIDSNSPTTKITNNIFIDKCVTVGTKLPLYISASTNVIISNCILDRSGDTTINLNHHLYINSYTQNIIIDNMILIGGNGYAFDIKNDASSTAVAPKRVVISNISLVGCNSFLVAEDGADVVVNNVNGWLDNTIFPGNTYIFGCYDDSILKVNNFKISGGSYLVQTIGSLTTGYISLENGKIGQLEQMPFISSGLKYCKLVNVEFEDIIGSVNHVGVWNLANSYSIALLEFYNCKFIFKTASTNDAFSHRANETRYYDCMFYVQAPSLTSGSIDFTYSGAISVFKNCTAKGNFTQFEYSGGSGDIRIFDCINENDKSIFNTQYEIKRFYGKGSPNGVISARQGSLYYRTDGGTNTTTYVKESGSGNTGWVAK